MYRVAYYVRSLYSYEMSYDQTKLHYRLRIHASVYI